MRTWIEPESIIVPDEFAADVGGHPIVAETLYRRGLQTTDEVKRHLYWQHYTPADPRDLPDMERAIKRLRQAIDTQEMIAVWGDFDVDGQTATALLVSALRKLGANVVSYIPQRLTEGHGIHIDSLNRLINNGAQIILTCDTGVDEHEAIEHAASHGVLTIVTDHHKLPDTLPEAYAVVNPRRVDVNHPLRDLPGVGVAYLLITMLEPNENWDHLLDLVALGIVADVAVQRSDTRYLLQRGLVVLQKAERLGLRVLMELAEINPDDLSEEDIAFRIAPRMNAIGRLGDANPTTELLTTNNLERARIIANQLEGLNAERQRLSEAVWQGVQATIAREPGLLKHAALVVDHPDWHTGVVGIVANRCVETYNRPALLIASPKETVARGSARSIAGVDITDAIAANRDLLVGYGGHTMAAGIAIERDRIDDFRRGLSMQVRQQQAGIDLTPTLTINRFVSLAEVDLDLVRDVQRLAPFGAGNPALVFATRNVIITSKRQLGRTDKHLKLTIEDEVGTSRTVLWWNAETPPTGKFDLAYTIRENTFRGAREVRIEWLDYRQAADETTVETQREIAIWDYRHEVDQAGVLTQLHQTYGDDLLVWGEVVSGGFQDAVDRRKLTTKRVLAVWTVPPDAATWQAALDTVKPEQLMLFGIDPDMDNADTFLSRLAGLVKYALRQHGGYVSYTDLAAATAQGEAAVRLGIMWLAAKGQVQVVEQNERVLKLEMGNKHTLNEAQPAERLQRLLNESGAYRAYWRRVDANRLR